MVDFANTLLAGPKKPLRLKQGIHRNVPMEAYISDPAPEPSLSKGIIKALWDKSPAHARLLHPRLSVVEDDASKASDLGSAAHGYYLLGDAAVEWVDADDWKTKAAREARDRARAAGKIPLLDKQRGQVEAMGAAARAVLAPRDPEVTLMWQERGVWLRCRPDDIEEQWQPEGAALDNYMPDYKTAKSSSPQAWARTSLYAGGYDIQAALCRRGMRALCLGEWVPLWIVGETEKPYAVSLIAPTEAMLALADKKIDKAIATWAQCLAAGEWPAYARGIHWADPPNYEAYAVEDAT